jgi:hypothetical protein
MRVAVSCAMALLAAVTLSAASSAHSATKADRTAIAAHSKANSFAPHAGPHSRVYGVPIQSPILKSHPKKKPQLTSSPLPESAGAKTPAGG